jgi:putative flippase GtrA
MLSTLLGRQFSSERERHDSAKWRGGAVMAAEAEAAVQRLPQPLPPPAGTAYNLLVGNLEKAYAQTLRFRDHISGATGFHPVDRNVRSRVRRQVEEGLAALIGSNGGRDSTELVRFVGAGCLNTGLGFAIYCFVILLGFSYVVANSIAWAVSVIVGFLLNSRFVFRKAYAHRRFVAFVGSNILSLFVSFALLTLLIHVFSVDAIVASLVTIPFVVAISYLAAKYGVFR